MESIECYSDEELYEGIQEIVSSSVVGACLAPSDKPQAILLGGQSGAGKTTLHNVFRNAMNGNVIVVNGDEYRSFHPRYKQICAQYGIDSPAHTAAWAGRMVEAIIDALSIMGYNLIIEGTLRTSEVPLKTARLLRDRGYSVSLRSWRLSRRYRSSAASCDTSRCASPERSRARSIRRTTFPSSRASSAI